MAAHGQRGDRHIAGADHVTIPENAVSPGWWKIASFGPAVAGSLAIAEAVDLAIIAPLVAGGWPRLPDRRWPPRTFFR